MVRIFKRMFWVSVLAVVAGCSSGSGTATSDGVPVAPTVPTVPALVQIGGTFQGIPLVLTGNVTTIAGAAGVPGSTDAIGAAARFSLPVGITTDGRNLYVADSDKHTIRKLVIASGVVTTLAGTAGLSGTTDASGAAARFFSPRGITTDGTYLYVAEMQSHTIRKIVISTGAVTTLAGTAGAQGSADAAGTAARFNSPAGITTDGTNLYVTDSGNNTIRKIVISSGVVTTLAGTAGAPGSTDDAGMLARFSQPVGVTTDGINLYVTDFGNNTIRQIIISSGMVSTLAGSAGLTGFANGAGSAARFTNPAGITTDGSNLYVSDYFNQTIRKVVISTGVVATLAGSAGLTGSADGLGAAARFNHPEGITSDGSSLFIADSDNHTIRQMN